MVEESGGGIRAIVPSFCLFFDLFRCLHQLRSVVRFWSAVVYFQSGVNSTIKLSFTPV